MVSICPNDKKFIDVLLYDFYGFTGKGAIRFGSVISEALVSTYFILSPNRYLLDKRKANNMKKVNLEPKV